MNSFSAMMPAVSTERIIRWFMAMLFATIIFWGLINENNIPRPPSRFSKRANVSERAATPIQAPGVIVGIVLGTLFGLGTVSVIAVCCALRRRKRNIHRCPAIIPEYEVLALHEVHGGPGRGFAPRDIWQPTVLELDMVSTQLQNPALSAPSPVGKPGQVTFYGQLAYNGTCRPIERGNTLPEVPNATNERLSEQPDRVGTQEPGNPSQSQPELGKMESNREPIEDESGTQVQSPQFTCPISNCAKTFIKQYELNQHMRYHNKSKKCETCDKTFGTVTHLERHVNSAHLSTKRFYCTAAGCKYSKTVPSPEFFSRKDNWRRHMKDKHGLN